MKFTFFVQEHSFACTIELRALARALTMYRDVFSDAITRARKTWKSCKSNRTKIPEVASALMLLFSKFVYISNYRLHCMMYLKDALPSMSSDNGFEKWIPHAVRQKKKRVFDWRCSDSSYIIWPRLSHILSIIHHSGGCRIEKTVFEVKMWSSNWNSLFLFKNIHLHAP